MQYILAYYKIVIKITKYIFFIPARLHQMKRRKKNESNIRFDIRTKYA